MLARLLNSVPDQLAAKIASEGRAAAGERKSVTIMFADISGFMALSERLDPEAVVEIINRCFEKLGQIVYSYEGTIDKYIGDCIMALFGAPISHEDDTERAVRASLDMREALANLSSELNVELTMHTGINTGAVIAVNVGSDLRMQYTVIGDAVNVAARLQSVAQAGQILVGESVYRLTQHAFDYAPRGEITLKGRAEPVLAYEPTTALRPRSRLEVAQQRVFSPFVGRAAETSILGVLLEEASQGRGQALALKSEAGAGKSRLLHEFKQGLPASTRYLEGRCLPYGGSSYQAIAEIVRQFFGFADVVTEADRKIISAGSLGLEEFVPCFEDLLSLPPRDPAYSLLDPQMRRNRTFAAVIALLRAACREQTLVLVIEDLHWVEPTTEEFLAGFLDVISSLRVLLVFLHRPDYQPPWQDRSGYVCLALSPLTRADSQRLIESLFDTDVAPALETYIYEHSGGNPFFIEELVRTLKETNVLRHNGQVSLDGSPEQPAVPATIEGVLGARIDRLDSDTRLTLEVASVLGQQFSVALLSHILEGSARLGEQLKALANAEFLQPADPPGDSYAFKHALTREVAYSRLMRSSRAKLHRRAAEAICEVTPEAMTAQPEVLAYHYTEAGLVESALPYWLQAGQRAIQRSANLEAITYLSKALELLPALPDGPERDQQEIQLQITLGVPLLASKGYAAPEVEAAYTRANELCEKIGETPQLLPVIYGLWAFFFVRAQHSEALRLATQLVTLGREAQDRSLLIQGHTALGEVLTSRGEFDEAMKHFGELEVLYDLGEHRSLAFVFGQDAKIMALSWSALTLWLQGYPEEAVRASQAALQLAEEVDHPFSSCYGLFCAAWLYYLRGEFHLVDQQAQACLNLSTAQGFPYWSAWASILGGAAEAARGLNQSALEKIGQGIAIHRMVGAGLGEPFYHIVLANALVQAGQIEKALDTVEQAIEVVERTGERCFAAELGRMKGELRLALHGQDDPVAEAEFLAARELAREQGARSLELRATISLHRLRERQGRGEESRALLADVYERFGEGRDTPDLSEARLLLGIA
jgi:class 3 adenylate cyclase/predicted ATPase